MGGRIGYFSVFFILGQLFLKGLQGRKEVRKRKEILPWIHFLFGVDVLQLWERSEVGPFLVGLFCVCLETSPWLVAKLHFACLQACLLWWPHLIITITPISPGPLGPETCLSMLFFQQFLGIISLKTIQLSSPMRRTSGPFENPYSICMSNSGSVAVPTLPFLFSPL